MTLVCFSINVWLIFDIEGVFEYLGAGDSKMEYDVTSLGISTTIMILFNMVAWPNIHESAEKSKPISEMDDEKDRADDLCRQLDTVVDYVSSIEGRINAMTDNGKKPPAK